MPPVRLETERLLLREWRAADREPFAALNADPVVMRFLPACLSRNESNELVERIEARRRQYGFGLFAVERKAERAFIGFIGLTVPAFEAYFTPCVEIGWRLAQRYWNQDLATEGAREVLRHGFEVFGLDEIVSFTVPHNLPSRRVMEKIGLLHDPHGDFDHPRLPEGHALRRQVLYRRSKELGARS